MSPDPTETTRLATKRVPWGHVSRHCVYCGKVGPRVIVVAGWAHRRCVPVATKQTRRPKAMS